MSNEINLLKPDTLLPPATETPAVPWSFRDTWIGFGLFVVCMFGLAVISALVKDISWAMSVFVLAYQPVQAIPIFAILLWRRASWADIGFQRAQPNVLAIGCGLTIGVFFVNFFNNLIMWFLKVEVQAQQFGDIIGGLEQPALFLVTGILIAPIIEEVVMRGFLFAGLRQRIGWVKAALLSSALFGALHLSIAAFIPTAALGLLFSYLYQRSNSIWPGIILHTLINSFGLCGAYLLTQYGDPSMFLQGLLWI